MAANKPKYASTTNPIFEAIAHGMFAFKSERQALEQLKEISRDFIISKEQPPMSKKFSLILWIKGFAVNGEEKDKGYTGNFALLSYEKIADDKFTIKAEKLESDVKYHPQRKREKKSHPNWGHPILRSIKKGKIYETIEQAQGELQLLHEEYPTISIPNPGKLYIIIYSKAKGRGSPIQKYVLEIKAAKDGGFYIEARDNDRKQKMPAGAAKKSEPVNQKAPKGYFTSMVQARQNRKRKPTT